MPTQAQLNANRLNALKSTGPTSPEGKAASSLNALKSGIDAWSHIIPGEDPAELEDLTAAYLDRKSTRLNSSHSQISYAVFCLKKKNDRPHNGVAKASRRGVGRCRSSP